MSKDLDEEERYISKKGKIPFRWTAPEVGSLVARGVVWLLWKCLDVRGVVW